MLAPRPPPLHQELDPESSRHAERSGRGVWPVWLCALALASCARDLPPVGWTGLTGDACVLSRFEGRWYDYGGAMMVEVGVGRRPRLALRVPRGFTIADGRTQGDEIHFSLRGRERETELSLRLVADDVLVVVGPGEQPSGCGTCTPRLARFTAAGLVRRRVQEVCEGMEEALQRTQYGALNWLIDVL